MNIFLLTYDFIVGLLIIAIIFILFFQLHYLAIILSFILLFISFFSREIREKVHFKCNKIGKKQESLNYIIEIPAVEKNSEHNRNIIIFAHYDSIGRRLNPIFSGVIFFISLIGGTFFSIHVLVSILLYLLNFIPLVDIIWFFYGFCLAGFYSIQLLNKRNNKSYGTADNATGVANAFYLTDFFNKNPLQYINLIIVLTGAEEMGDQGAYDYIKRNSDNLNKDKSYFLIVDSVGANKDENLYFYAQGFPKKRFSPIIERNIKHLLSSKKEEDYKINPMYIPPLIHFSTDHAPLKPYGYEFMIFGSNGSIHSENDNINNYYPEMVEKFNQFSRDLIIQMDKKIKIK